MVLVDIRETPSAKAADIFLQVRPSRDFEVITTLRAAKAEGLPITVETCPHYLCLEAESIPDGATLYKCAPPIREHENREGLWRGLLDGVIDFVITDHSPCIPALKVPERGDFEEALRLIDLTRSLCERGASMTELAPVCRHAAGASRRRGR